MFTPSLLSMMLHSVGFASPNRPQSGSLETTEAVATDLGRLLALFRESSLPIPSVPVIGHTSSLAQISSYVEYSERAVPGAPGTLRVWGRVPIDVLIQRLSSNHALSTADEYLDLGTPLIELQQTGTDVSECQKYLSHSPPLTPLLQVALIDLGEASLGHSPDDFGGRVNHLNSKDVVFAPHASKVLETLLRRLNDYPPLVQELELIVGLISPPNKHIGLKCFEHANSVELQSTLEALARYVGGGGIPLIANLSLGTHVGPHKGTSPLEESIKLQLPFSGGRTLICAAGNDGIAGIAASRKLNPHVAEHLRLRTDARGCRELLVELWWEEGQSSSVTVSVEIKDLHGRVRGAQMTIAPRTRAVNAMLQAGPSFNSVTCESLYYGQSTGVANCIAFALSAGSPADLANLNINFEILGVRTTLDLDAWVVLPTDQSCSFVGGGVDSSICVPATLPEVLAVAGVNKQGQPWHESSRGMPGQPGSPALAHMVEYASTGEKGTSYAAPRATADVTERIRRSAATSARPDQLRTFSSPAELAEDVILKHNPTAVIGWDSRTGYGCVTNGS